MESSIERLQKQLDIWSLSREVPPGLGIGVIRESKVETFYWGRTSTEASDFIDESIQWHIGSCAKSLTAYLISNLVTEGHLEYESPLGDLIRTRSMSRSWGAVTVSQLLCHSSGLIDCPELFADISQDMTLDGVQGRKKLKKIALSNERNFLRDEKSFNYSNLGYCLLGAIIDEMTGSFESTMTNSVLKPLALSSAGFGAPLIGAKGHLFHEGRLTPIEPSPHADNHPALTPAGRIHLTLDDWLTYLRFILSGNFPAVWDDPHQAMYTRGAFVKRARGKYLEYSHSGSNRLWYASVSLIPEIHHGVVVTTNWGGGFKGTSDINHHLIDEFWRDAIR